MHIYDIKAQSKTQSGGLGKGIGIFFAISNICNKMLKLITAKFALTCERYDPPRSDPPCQFRWYRDTSDSMRWHRDAHATRGGLAAAQNISIIMSFGAPRRLVFRHLRCRTEVPIVLRNGSVLAFGAGVNSRWYA